MKKEGLKDPKSHLQEIVQNQQGFTPVYKVINEEGPDHDKTFTVGVYINGQIQGTGMGPSKQSGQQQAAQSALRSYNSQLSDQPPNNN